MHQHTLLTIGLDLGDRFSTLCLLDHDGKVLRNERFSTDVDSLCGIFQDLPPHRIAMEVGKSSPWISRLLTTMGHEVIVANARNVHLISKSQRKNDQKDAELLARLAKSDPALLSPITHHSEQTQEDLAQLRSRDQLVSCRVKLLNCVRGILLSFGIRIGSHSAEAFVRKVEPLIPENLRPALLPQLQVIEALNEQVHVLDRQLTALAQERYPVVDLLQTVPGVGPITAMAFALIVENPERFPDTRQVGAYLGLVPRQCQSGDQDPELRITKGGNAMLRRLLVSGGQRLLGPFGPDCALRRKGLKMCEKGGKRIKKRAVVMIARKMAVMMLAMWKSGTTFEPFPNARTAILEEVKQ